MPFNPRLATHGIRTVKTIVFDAVGTLIYANPSVADVYQSIAEPFGWRGTRDSIKHRFSVAFSHNNNCPADRITNEADQRDRWRAIVGRVFNELHANVVDSIFNRLWMHFADPAAWQLYPDAIQAIDTCQRHQIQWCIASNFDSRLHHVVAGHWHLMQASSIFCSSLVGFEKPSRKFYDHINAVLNQPAEHLLMIGDDCHLDFQGAKTAGWNSLWLDRSSEQPQLEGVSDIFRIHRLDEIFSTG